MNWKYLLAYLTLLSSTSHSQEEEEEEEERMCGEGLVWCDDPLTPYPHHIIKNINSSHPVWPHLTRRRRQVEERNQENHKHFQHACETIDDLIVPRAGRNKQNKWRYILNSEDSRPELQQVIKIGKCEHTESCHGQWAGHRTQCRQLYLEHKLVAITDKGEVLKDTFLFPSCCSCRVINTIQD